MSKAITLPGQKAPSPQERTLSPVYCKPLTLDRLRPVPPEVVMGDPDRLARAVSGYFLINSSPVYTDPAHKNRVHNVPTFEGLSLACGFTSFKSAQKEIMSDANPQESKDVLIIGLSHIADIYQQLGITDQANSSFIKYLMSAYLNISEKAVTQIENDTKITISWENPGTNADREKRGEVARELISQKSKADMASQTSLEEELRALEAQDIEVEDYDITDITGVPSPATQSTTFDDLI